jgi:hypothetical protein
MFFMDATLPDPPRRPLSERGGASNGGEPLRASNGSEPAVLFPS